MLSRRQHCVDTAASGSVAYGADGGTARSHARLAQGQGRRAWLGEEVTKPSAPFVLAFGVAVTLALPNTYTLALPLALAVTYVFEIALALAGAGARVAPACCRRGKGK